MLRVRWVCLLSLGLLLAFCGPAFAYTTPSGLGSWPNQCPPWPADGSDGANTTMEQELANLCLEQKDGQQAQHTDLSQIDSDTQAVTSAVKSLTANGTTLDTLHGDLAQLHSDLTQLDSDLKAQPGPASTVELGASTMSSLNGIGEALHEDLFVIVGAIVGLFALTEVLRKVWP